LNKTTVVPPDKPVTVPPIDSLIVDPHPVSSNSAIEQNKHPAIFKSFIFCLGY